MGSHAGIRPGGRPGGRGGHDISRPAAKAAGLADVAGQQRRLTVDVSELSFLDSSIVVVFLVAAQMLRERGGELMLLHPQDPVLRALRLLGADGVITIAKDPTD